MKKHHNHDLSYNLSAKTDFSRTYLIINLIYPCNIWRLCSPWKAWACLSCRLPIPHNFRSVKNQDEALLWICNWQERNWKNSSRLAWQLSNFPSCIIPRYILFWGEKCEQLQSRSTFPATRCQGGWPYCINLFRWYLRQCGNVLLSLPWTFGQSLCRFL